MKPGIPWSVKGIEQQARAAAKQAARRSGMTIGEWLNTVILDSADGGDDLERRYSRPPYRPKPLPGSEHGQGEEVTLRLEEIAEQLHTIARQESDTAVSRQAGPEDEAALRAIVERLDAYEQHTSSALGAMQERFDEVLERLGRLPEHKLPERAEDVPGYPALEGALRNIIEHIEVSETRTRDAIKSLQERLAEVMDRSGNEPASAAAVSQLEQRVAELAERMAGTDVPVHPEEMRAVEQRLRSLLDEAKQATWPMDQDEDLSRLQGEIDSLKQRFDDRKVEAVSERHVDSLRLEIEQLTATVSQASGHALDDLERRLEALSARIEEQGAAAGADALLDELSGRVQHLEAKLKSRFGERDPDTESEVAALSERIAATEQRLEHLATIERSVAQLAHSLETSRSATAEAGGSGHTVHRSPELKALEDGLNAVRASAELSDRSTQETLQAVHETLEQIVAKFAELEAQVKRGGEELAVEVAEKPDQEPDQEPEPAQDAAEASVQPAAEEPSEEFAREPSEEADMAIDAEFESSAPPEPDQAVTEAEGESDQMAVMAADAEHYAFAADRLPEDAESASREESQIETADEPAWGVHDPAQPEPTLVPEDYIAAARRAAQMAATRHQNPVTSGFNRFSRRLAGGGQQSGKSADDGTCADTKGNPSDEPHKARKKKSTRKRLILAGLVLLAAVSAYGVHRHVGSLPAFNPAPGPVSGPAAGSADVARQQAQDLPAEIGTPSLRQAALSGDVEAQFVVASRYLEGKVVTRDEEQAAQWYRRAALKGLAAAQYRLGSMYEHGLGMPLDREAAQVWYEKAAMRGNLAAMHNLAVLLADASTGQPYYELAVEWFRKAAERGLKDSQFNLAVLSDEGLGVPKNPQEAVFWYILAAAQGDREAAAKAKALESSLAPEGARRLHHRLLAWQPRPADRAANSVPVGESFGRS